MSNELSAMLRLHLEQMAIAKALKPRTVDTYSYMLGLIDASLDDTVEQLQAKIDKIPSPNTRRACALAVRSILEQPVRIGVPVSRQWVLPDIEDVHEVAANSPYKTQIYLMAVCGLRIGEAAAITTAQVYGNQLIVERQINNEGQIVSVKAGEGVVIIPDWLSEMIVNNEPVSRQSLSNHLSYLSRKTGKKFNADTLRSFAANNLLHNAIDIYSVSKMLRHSSVKTTEQYYLGVDARMMSVLDGLAPAA